MKYLGIDYGSKRIGLAMSDDGGTLAFPLKIISNDVFLIEAIAKICQTENIAEIVIGESFDLSGKANKIMGDINDFKTNLAESLKLPISFQKEFMTTVEARGREGKEVNNARKVAKPEQAQADASAAALILQRFLDKKNLR